MTALFDHIGDQFLAYYDSTQGAIRGEVVRRNLEGYLGDRRLNILDVGCGEGRDALLAYAARSHSHSDRSIRLNARRRAARCQEA